MFGSRDVKWRILALVPVLQAALNGLARFGRLKMSGNISQLVLQAITHVDWVGSIAVVLLMVAITMVGHRINHPIL